MPEVFFKRHLITLNLHLGFLFSLQNVKASFIRPRMNDNVVPVSDMQAPAEVPLRHVGAQGRVKEGSNSIFPSHLKILLKLYENALLSKHVQLYWAFHFEQLISE